MEEVQEKDAPPVRLALKVAYLGDRFYGSQMQTSERTVEGEFVRACYKLNLFRDFRDAGFAAAGRTDRGVHAMGQIFSFSTSFPERAITALNYLLPDDCWIKGYSYTENRFHPRYDAKSRTYRYYFGTNTLDTAAMDAAVRYFIGHHDFSAFAKSDNKNPERVIYNARVFCEGTCSVFEVTAESFLWHMVRYMAAALRMIGEGKEGEDTISARLLGVRTIPFSPAPPEGLVLWDVDCGITFFPVPVVGKRHAFLLHLHERHTSLERVLRDLNAGSF